MCNKLYLTCRDGTMLTIPDDDKAIWNLGAPWEQIFENSSLLSNEALKYVTYRPYPVFEDDGKKLTKKSLLARLKSLELRLSKLEKEFAIYKTIK